MRASEMLDRITPELFWDVDVERLHPRTHARFIIRRVLERGTRKQVDSIYACYSRETIRDALVTARSLDPKTLSYFAAVYEIPLHEFRAFREFYLVGGTALSLRLGHRISVDIDLFCPHPFDSAALSHQLDETIGLLEATHLRNTLRGNARGIKLECIAHRYPLLNPLEEKISRRKSVELGEILTLFRGRGRRSRSARPSGNHLGTD